MFEFFTISFTIGAFSVILIMGIVTTVILPALDVGRKIFFIGFYILISLFLVVCIGDCFAYEKPEYITVEKIVAYFEYLIPSVVFVLMTHHLLYRCGKDAKKSKYFHIALALWCIFFVLLQIAQFTDAMYYITPENSFIRGRLHLLLVFPLFAIMTLNIAALFHYKNTISKRTFKHFIFYFFPIEIALFLHPFFSTMVFIIIAVIICAITLFAVVLSEQVISFAHQQEEISDQRSKITVLQMRPHFIYNTMTSIYYLCEQDPKKAQQITLDFTNYLRKIFKAVVSEDVIPFSEELEHTRAYVNVAVSQIGDRLRVDYDTPHILFDLPPLTLQPLVENAVKHGMNPDSEAICISVKTRKADGGSEITVKDNGVGFDLDSISPQSTLSNIRERLNKLVGGTMTIESSPNGTTVTIFVPDKK